MTENRDISRSKLSSFVLHTLACTNSFIRSNEPASQSNEFQYEAIVEYASSLAETKTWCLKFASQISSKQIQSRAESIRTFHAERYVSEWRKNLLKDVLFRLIFPIAIFYAVRQHLRHREFLDLLRSNASYLSSLASLIDNPELERALDAQDPVRSSPHG